MICAFIIVLLIGYTQSQNCSPASRCASAKINFHCLTDLNQDPFYKCLHEIFKDCHNSKELELLFSNVKLANEVFCKNETVANAFKQHDLCWDELNSCIKTFGQMRNEIKTDASQKNTICKQVNNTSKMCVMQASGQCRDIDQQFTDVVYNDIFMCEMDISPTPDSAHNFQPFHILTMIATIVCYLYL